MAVMTMRPSSNDEDPEARRLQEAVAWRLRLTERGLTDYEAFDHWLAEDPRNLNAWRSVQQPWDFIGQQANTPELLQLRYEALRDSHHASRRLWLSSGRTARIAKLAGVAAVLFIAFAGLAVSLLQRPDVYRTGVGERRLLALSDGSRVTLDSDSEIRVRFSETGRNLVLARGQARFDVSHDAARPFSVTVAERRIVATGTAFNVDLLDSYLMLTLINGRVTVRPTQAAANRSSDISRNPTRSTFNAIDATGIDLVAGQQLVIPPQGVAVVTTANLARVTAWQNGELVFQDELLPLVVARVNRYSTTKIVLGDPGLSTLRISGVFDAENIDSFASALSDYFGLRTIHRGNTIAITRR